MSETEAPRRRGRPPGSRSSSSSSSSAGKVVETYDDGLEAGYIGGPVDEVDHTVAGELAAAEAASSEEASSE